MNVHHIRPLFPKGSDQGAIGPAAPHNLSRQKHLLQGRPVVDFLTGPLEALDRVPSPAQRSGLIVDYPVFAARRRGPVTVVYLKDLQMVPPFLIACTRAEVPQRYSRGVVGGNRTIVES